MRSPWAHEPFTPISVEELLREQFMAINAGPVVMPMAVLTRVFPKGPLEEPAPASNRAGTPPRRRRPKV